MNVARIIEQLRRIILAHAAPERIWIYGSRIRDDYDIGSDLDVAYDDSNADYGIHEKITEEIDRLETLIKIDVKNIALAEKRFAQRVRDTGKVIFSATSKLKVEDGFYNFNKALSRFKGVIERKKQLEEDGYGDIYLDLIVKRFEFTFELAWKVIKRMVEFEGLTTCKSPRSCIKEALSLGIITNEALWLEMIERRNQVVHIYDEWQISEMKDRVSEFARIFDDLASIIATRFKDLESE